METNGGQIPIEFETANSAVQIPTQNSTTQIYLIREDIPPSQENKNNLGAKTSHLADSRQQKIVKISSHGSSTNILQNKQCEPPTRTPRDSSGNSIASKNAADADTPIPRKKSRTSAKAKLDGPYTCDKCKKSFKKETSLKAHVRRTYCQEGKSLVRKFSL